MKRFRLPYALIPFPAARRIAAPIIGIGESIQGMFPFLKLHLKQAQIDITVKEYLSACIITTLFFSVFFGVMLFIILLVSGVERLITFSLMVAGFLALFVMLQQIAYPKTFAQRRVKDIEKNLMPALQNMLVQLNAGVPLFDTIVNIADGEYGGISAEFSRAVKGINAGTPQIDALEEVAAVNPSLFFRRAVWQLVNGMKSGSDISRVINEIMSLLSEEQLLQIQRYGSQLNPLAMFYMLVVVIVPSLGMTFLIILSSFISLEESTTKMIFWALLGVVVFFQVMFMGIIKAKRPNLLGD